MLGRRYYGGRYFGPRYFGDGGLPVDGSYNGARFFGPRYFGPRYFSTVSSGAAVNFDIEQTNVLALAGTLGLTGDLEYAVGLDFEVAAPLELPPLAGVLGLTGDLEYAVGAVDGSYMGRYFGSKFFGPRYFSTTGVVSVALEQANVLALTGTLGLSGDLVYVADAPIEQTNTLALAGVLGLTGDLAYNEIDAQLVSADRIWIATREDRIWTATREDRTWLVAAQDRILRIH